MAKRKEATMQHLITQQTASLPSTGFQRFLRRLSFKRLRRIKITHVILYLFMLALICFMMLPLVYMVVTAFKPIDELLIYPPRFYTTRIVFDNFTNLSDALSSTTVPFSTRLPSSTSALQASEGMPMTEKTRLMSGSPTTRVRCLATM